MITCLTYQSAFHPLVAFKLQVSIKNSHDCNYFVDFDPLTLVIGLEILIYTTNYFMSYYTGKISTSLDMQQTYYSSQMCI